MFLIVISIDCTTQGVIFTFLKCSIIYPNLNLTLKKKREKKCPTPRFLVANSPKSPMSPWRQTHQSVFKSVDLNLVQRFLAHWHPNLNLCAVKWVWKICWAWFLSGKVSTGAEESRPRRMSGRRHLGCRDWLGENSKGSGEADSLYCPVQRRLQFSRARAAAWPDNITNRKN
jgi:hypothetical protein